MPEECHASLQLEAPQAPRSGDAFQVPCIFGASPLDRYSITSLVFDGCFQAYDPIVNEDSLPFAT